MKKKRTLLKCGMGIFRAVIFGILICVIVLFSMSFLLDSTWGKVTIQSLFMLVFGFVIYNEAWFQGDKDKNLEQFGHIKQDLYWGTKIGLIGMILPALGSLLLVFSKIPSLPDLTFVYKIINPHLAVLINLFIPIADRNTYSFLQIIGVTLYQVLIPLFSTVGYVLGYKRINITEKIVFINKINPKKEK